jgi:hypothetical protein
MASRLVVSVNVSGTAVEKCLPLCVELETGEGVSGGATGSGGLAYCFKTTIPNSTAITVRTPFEYQSTRIRNPPAPIVLPGPDISAHLFQTLNAFFGRGMRRE